MSGAHHVDPRRLSQPECSAIVAIGQQMKSRRRLAAMFGVTTGTLDPLLMRARMHRKTIAKVRLVLHGAPVVVCAGVH